MLQISYKSIAIFVTGIGVGLWIPLLLNLLSWYIWKWGLMDLCELSYYSHREKLVGKIVYNLDKVPQHYCDAIFEIPKYYSLFTRKPDRLLSIGLDAKTVKNEKVGVITGIQYLLPSDRSGMQTCAMALMAGCHEPCLRSAGRGRFQSVEMGRLRKTLFYYQYLDEYKILLEKEIMRVVRKAEKENCIPSIRLNGTSDIRWELIVWDIMVKYSKEYGVKWYDYTKIANRMIPDSNIYHLTFSYSGKKGYKKYVDQAISRGMNIAMVVQGEIPNNTNFLPKKYSWLDGDKYDARFLDGEYKWVHLKAKGDAKKDTGDFVVRLVA